MTVSCPKVQGSLFNGVWLAPELISDAKNSSVTHSHDLEFTLKCKIPRQYNEYETTIGLYTLLIIKLFHSQLFYLFININI